MLTHMLLEQNYQTFSWMFLIYSAMLTHLFFKNGLRHSGMLTHLIKTDYSTAFVLFRYVDPPTQAIIVRSFLMSFALKNIKEQWHKNQ
jgi:hypothetical protein